ncbi:restriction endonuclease subunit S, partial [Brachyspira hampsonii]
MKKNQKEWQEVYFGDKNFISIIDGDRGKNYPKENDFFDEEFCLFLNTKNVTKNGFNFQSNKYITEEKDSILRNGKLNRYDIVMTTRGTIGNIAFYGDNIPYDNIRINSGMVIIRAEHNKIIPKYLYMLLKSKYIQDKISMLTTGTAQPQLPISDIIKINFLLPSLEEQKKIA